MKLTMNHFSHGDVMRMHRAVLATLSLMVAFGNARMIKAQSADLTVFCSTPLRLVMDELVPQFEHTVKYHVAVAYASSGELKQKIEHGEAFDVVIVTPSTMDDLIKDRKVAGETRTAIARIGVALAIRAGAPRPDIRTTDAFKQTLLKAHSIAYGKEGASGAYYVGLVERLGLAEALKSKTQVKDSGDEVGRAVASGEAELGVIPVSEILSVRGTEVLGTFPADIQSYVVLVGGVATNAKSTAAAKELLEFLAGPMALPVLTKKGVER